MLGCMAQDLWSAWDLSKVLRGKLSDGHASFNTFMQSRKEQAEFARKAV